MSAALKQSIERAYSLFDDLGQAQFIRNQYSLNPLQEFNAVALDTSSSYTEVFHCALRLSYFNFRLKDYSFFQFSQSTDTEQRFAFFPSPFSPKQLEVIQWVDDLQGSGQVDPEKFSYLIQEMDVNATRPLIRYEYSESQYVHGRHPSAHLHFGTYGEDRWPVRRRLTPYAFALLIARLYFQPDWEALTEDHPYQGRTNKFDMDYFAEKQGCPLTDVQYFGQIEERLFHFA